MPRRSPTAAAKMFLLAILFFYPGVVRAGEDCKPVLAEVEQAMAEAKGLSKQELGELRETVSAAAKKCRVEGQNDEALELLDTAVAILRGE